MLHPVIVLCTRLLHARSPVSLAVIGGLESSSGIESSDEEQIVAECDDSQGVQPGDLAKIKTISHIPASTNGWKPRQRLGLTGTDMTSKIYRGTHVCFRQAFSLRRKEMSRRSMSLTKIVLIQGEVFW